MTRLRAEKIAKIQVPDLEVEGDKDDADLLIVGFGSTYGHLHAAMDELRGTVAPHSAPEGATDVKSYKVALAQFRYLNPLPANTAEVLKRMKVDGFVPEQFNQVKGQPFVVSELVEAFSEIINK